MIIAIDPILDILIGAGLWYIYHQPKPTAPDNKDEVSVVIEAEEAAPSPAVLNPDQHRVSIQHLQPDGLWHEIGHAEFASRDNPGERILREISTPGRRVVGPDGEVWE